MAPLRTGDEEAKFLPSLLQKSDAEGRRSVKYGGDPAPADGSSPS